MKVRLVFFLLICASLAFGQAAEKPSVSFRAASQWVAGSIVHLRGEVEMLTPRITLRADEVNFDVSTGIFEAHGTVRTVLKGVESVNIANYARLDINKSEIIFRMPMPQR
jgi:lipopolysaccharide assembly outer membrane protein LptD (OstA)